MKERILFFIVGLFILTLGVGLIIQSGLGASAWDALAVGESKTFGITVGTCVIINGVLLIFLNSFLLKKKPEYFAGVTIIVIGTLIDFWLLILEPYTPVNNLLLQLSFLITGIVILGIGIAVYLQAKFPASPMDTLMVAIHKRFGLSLRIARIASEGFALTLAFLFKGAIGVGTIIVTVTLGFVVQYFYSYFEFLLNKMGQKFSTTKP